MQQQQHKQSLQIDNEVTYLRNIPELDTFEEFCSNIPDQDNLEINFSKPSMKSEHLKTNESKISNQSIRSKKRKVDSDSQLQQKTEPEQIQEPPAPQNKNTMKFCFPQSRMQFIETKYSSKQSNNNSQSATEQTLLKQQSFDNKLQQRQISEENSQKNELETICLQLSEQNKNLETKITEQQDIINRLIQENLILSKKLSHLAPFPETNECLSVNAYLFQKLNQKCQENARLKYEIIKLQNNIELQETTQLLNQPNFIDTTKALHTDYGNNQSRDQSKESKTSLNNHQQSQPHKTLVNLSNMISPLSKYAQIIQQRQSQQIQRNSQYKEDDRQKISHIKNSTSVGELANQKQEFVNYSNIIQRILKKESYSINSPQGRATEKFKQALNEKLSNLQQENSKSISIFSINQLKELHKQSHKQNFTRKQSDTEESHRSQGASEKKKQTSSDICQIMNEIRARKVGSIQLVSTSLNSQIKSQKSEGKNSRIKH